MKNIFLLCFFAFTFISCRKIDTSCMQGTVIGKIRSSGGGLAVSLHKHYHKAVKWQGHKNVIELLNIPEDMQLEGTTIYFKSRIATTEEQGIITADGEESLKLVLYGKNFSIDACP